VVAAHAEGDVGVCCKNYLDPGESGPGEWWYEERDTALKERRGEVISYSL